MPIWADCAMHFLRCTIQAAKSDRIICRLFLHIMRHISTGTLARDDAEKGSDYLCP